MKLLPEVPTEEMIVSAVNLHMGLPNKAMRLIYEAMYSAAPSVECEDAARVQYDMSVEWNPKLTEDLPAGTKLYTTPRTSKLTEMLMGIDEVDTTPNESDTPSEKLLKYLIQDCREAEAKNKELEVEGSIILKAVLNCFDNVPSKAHITMPNEPIGRVSSYVNGEHLYQAVKALLEKVEGTK